VATRADHFQRLIVEPTLVKLGEFNPKLDTPASIVLMMGTAAQESDLGYFWVQNTPEEVGKGWYSMEAATLDWLQEYLERESNRRLFDIIASMVSLENQANWIQELIDNPKFATAMARIKYWTIPAAVPAVDDLLALGAYWDKYYNGNPDYGTAAEWEESYRHFVKGER